MSGSETRAGEIHPAVALIRAGDLLEAERSLIQRGDDPHALAMLQHGYPDFAETILRGRATTAQSAPGRPLRAESTMAMENTREGAGGAFLAQQTACQGRKSR